MAGERPHGSVCLCSCNTYRRGCLTGPAGAMLLRAHPPSAGPDPIHACTPQAAEGHAGDAGEGPGTLLLARLATRPPLGRGALLTDLLAHGSKGLPGALCFFCEPDVFGMVGFFPHAHPPFQIPHLPSPFWLFLFLERALRQLY